MASERDFELLDDYLRHQLNAGESAAFEQKLEADHTLRNEYSLQQRIVENIRQARTAELKAMLNNIPVSAIQGGGETSLLAKLGMGIGAAVLVGLGIYFYSSKDEATKPEPQPIVRENKSENTAPVTEDQPKLEAPVTSTEPAQKEEEKVKSSKQTKIKSPEKPAEKPVINAFDPTEENEDRAEAVTEKTETSAKVESGASIPVETIDYNKKYNFHYQFKDGKLVLYGSFEKNLYEIMEFFADNKRTMFLFYKDNYYLLDEENEKIKPLNSINDPALLKKLRAYRGN